MSMRRVFLVALLPVLLCGGSAVGSWAHARSDSDRSARPAGHALRLWQTEDGLPQNTVAAILQTRDGYLWVGTYGGLARFDGVRFRKFGPADTPGLADGRIVSLFEDASGVLWIGHDSGRLTRYAGGRFEPVSLRTPAGAGRVVALGSGTDGAVWVLRAAGMLENTTSGAILDLDGSRPTPQVIALARSGDGGLHVGSDGEVYRVEHDALRPLDFGSATRTGFAMGVGGGARDGLWVVRDWRVQKWRDGRLVEDRGPPPWGGDASLSVLLEMRNGALAVGTMDRGLYVLEHDGRFTRFDQANGLPQNWVRSLCEDREGNLWVGAGSAGLVAVVPVPFGVVNAPDQWQGRSALAVAAARDGSLWIGTEGAGLYRQREGEWVRFAADEGLTQPFVWSVAEDGAGQIWAGTWGGGIFRLNGGQFMRHAAYDPDRGPVLALQTTSDGVLWVGGGDGLDFWPSTRDPVRPVTLVGGLAVSTVVQDRAGVLWFGVNDGGLGRVAGGEVRRFRKADGLSSDSVQCLLADAQDALWIGTADGGLVRLKDGRFASIGVEQGLASHAISHIEEDELGHVWLSTHHGIQRLSKRELHACADGRLARVEGLVFTRADGLPTMEFSGGLHGSGCRSSDGRLWFASSKGVVWVDPARLWLNRVVPPVAIEAVQIDGRRQTLSAAGISRVRLEPRHQRLEFEFTALSLTAPAKVFFKYKLEGIDETWVEAGTRRAATYSHLPAGEYVFRVIARNNDGIWNNEGAAIAVDVLPYFWETWWFLAPSLLLGLATMVWIVRRFAHRRMQRRLEDLERRHALERERARIAQDIHDDVGASLTRISMLSQCVPRESAPSGAAADVLDQICSTAREMTRALDEIVWAVDPRHDSLDSLVGYMGAYAQDFLASAGLRCRLDVPVSLPAWPLTAEVRHNLFLAFKEALNNAVRHAGASEVQIGLRLEMPGFVLTVADNGHGVQRGEGGDGSPTQRRLSGHGLENMVRRLATIGGECRITPGPSGGTIVGFVVPAPQSDRSMSTQAGAGLDAVP